MVDCLDGTYINTSCVCNPGSTFPVNFGIVKNQTCQWSITFLDAEYGFFGAFFILSLLISIALLIVYAYFTAEWDMTAFSPFATTVASLIFMILSNVAWVADSTIILVEKQRSTVHSRYMFWTALSLFILVTETSLLLIKSALSSAITKHQRMFRGPWYTNPVMSFLNILFLIPGFVLSAWDRYTSVFHLSLASAWVFIVVLNATAMTYYLYYFLTKTGSENKDIHYLKANLWVFFWLNIGVLIIFFSAFILAIINVPFAETVFTIGITISSIKQFIYFELFIQPKIYKVKQVRNNSSRKQSFQYRYI